MRTKESTNETLAEYTERVYKEKQGTITSPEALKRILMKGYVKDLKGADTFAPIGVSAWLRRAVEVYWINEGTGQLCVNDFRAFQGEAQGAPVRVFFVPNINGVGHYSSVREAAEAVHLGPTPFHASPWQGSREFQMPAELSIPVRRVATLQVSRGEGDPDLSDGESASATQPELGTTETPGQEEVEISDESASERLTATGSERGEEEEDPIAQEDEERPTRGQAEERQELISEEEGSTSDVDMSYQCHSESDSAQSTTSEYSGSSDDGLMGRVEGLLMPTEEELRPWQDALDDTADGHCCAQCTSILASRAGLLQHVRKGHLGPAFGASMKDKKDAVIFAEATGMMVCLGAAGKDCEGAKGDKGFRFIKRKGKEGPVGTCNECTKRRRSTQDGEDSGCSDLEGRGWTTETLKERWNEYNADRIFVPPPGWTDKGLQIGGKSWDIVEILTLAGPTTTRELKPSTIVAWGIEWASIARAATQQRAGAQLAMTLFESVTFKTLLGPKPAKAVMLRLKAWARGDYVEFVRLGGGEDAPPPEGGPPKTERDLTTRVRNVCTERGPSAASRVMGSEGRAAHDQAQSAQQRAKFHQGEGPFTMADIWDPEKPWPTAPRTSAEKVATVINGSPRNGGPGPGGLSMTALQQWIRHPALGTHMLEVITDFTNKCFEGQLNPEAASVINTSRLMPLYKESLAARETAAAEARERGGTAVPAARPIGILGVIRRLVAKLMNEHEDFQGPVHQHLGMTQLGVGVRGGVEIGINTIKAAMRLRTSQGKTTLCIALDAGDAYARAPRWIIARTVAEVAPGALHFIAMINGQTNQMIWDSEVFDVEQGVIQGDAISPTLYALSVHGLASRAREYIRQKGWTVLIFFYLDDCFVIGDPEQAYMIVHKIKEWGAEFGYVLNGKKSQVCLTGPEGVEMTPEQREMHRANLVELGGPGGPLGAPVVDGIPHLAKSAIVLGCPVGDQAEALEILRRKVTEATASVKAIRTLTDKQLATLMLIETRNVCLLNSLLRTTDPADFIDPASGRSILAEFDEQLDATVGWVLALEEDKQTTGEVPELDPRTSARAQLPLGRGGGLGIRHAEALGPAAYAAALADNFNGIMALLQQDGFMTEAEGRQAVKIITDESWERYDGAIRDVPLHPSDLLDEEGEPIPFDRDCLTRPYVNPREVKLQNYHRQRALTTRIDRKVKSQAGLEMGRHSGTAHARRIAGLDSRFLRAIPGRPGATELTNPEMAACLQHVLGVEHSYALKDMAANKCGVMGPPKGHSIPGCIKTGAPAKAIMDRHNHSANELARQIGATGLHGRVSSHHSKTLKLTWVENGKTLVLEPADVAVYDMRGQEGRAGALDLTFVDTSSEDNRFKPVTDALTARREKKLAKYGAACSAHKMAFRPLVFTAGGRSSIETASHLVDLFGIDIEGMCQDGDKGEKLFAHIFLGRGRCPQGLQPEQYERILCLKRALTAVSGICARSTARSLLSHSRYRETFLSDSVRAEWERAMMDTQEDW